MEQFVVRLDRASSLTGVAFIGPSKADGFKVDNKESAAHFDSIHEAGQYANTFKNRWRGFHGFSPEDIVVEAVASFTDKEAMSMILAHAVPGRAVSA